MLPRLVTLHYIWQLVHILKKKLKKRLVKQRVGLVTVATLDFTRKFVCFYVSFYFISTAVLFGS